MGFTIDRGEFPEPPAYLLQNALVDICRMRGGRYGVIKDLDFTTDRVVSRISRYRPEDADRIEPVRYKSIRVDGNDLVLMGEFANGDFVKDRHNMTYLSFPDRTRIWEGFPDSLKKEVNERVEEIRSAPAVFDSQLMTDAYKVSVDASKDIIRYPYSEDFAGQATWSKGFNLEKPFKLSNGIEIIGVRAIDFKDCTLFGVVTRKGEHYNLEDLVRGRDCEPFGKAVREHVDKILSNKARATLLHPDKKVRGIWHR